MKLYCIMFFALVLIAQQPSLRAMGRARHLHAVAAVKLKEKCNAKLISVTSRNSSLCLVKFFLWCGADVNTICGAKCKCKPLVFAAGNGNSAMVKLLLQKGSAVDGRDAGGNTALSWAAFNGCVESVRALLAAGAQVNIANYLHKTAVELAIRSLHPEIVKILLEKGVDIDEILIYLDSCDICICDQANLFNRTCGCEANLNEIKEMVRNKREAQGQRNSMNCSNDTSQYWSRFQVGEEDEKKSVDEEDEKSIRVESLSHLSTSAMGKHDKSA